MIFGFSTWSGEGQNGMNGRQEKEMEEKGNGEAG